MNSYDLLRSMNSNITKTLIDEELNNSLKNEDSEEILKKQEDLKEIFEREKEAKVKDEQEKEIKVQEEALKIKNDDKEVKEKEGPVHQKAESVSEKHITKQKSDSTITEKPKRKTPKKASMATASPIKFVSVPTEDGPPITKSIKKTAPKKSKPKPSFRK
jgi:hypothetical protein